MHDDASSPLRQAAAFVLLTIALTWLFWLPGAFLSTAMGQRSGDFLLAIGSFAPLAAAALLEIWLRQSSLAPRQWVKALQARLLLLAFTLPAMWFAPLWLLRWYEGTLDGAKLIQDVRATAWGFLGLLVLGLGEEMGWRAFLLPRLQALPLYGVNLLVGAAWFLWQLPLVLVGRYNTFEDFDRYLLASFLYAMLVTPFFNRFALRSNYSPLPSAVLRAGLAFMLAVYFLQGRADPLTDIFGTAMLGWLVALNLLLFGQLWQGKKPLAEITALDRVMPPDGEPDMKFHRRDAEHGSTPVNREHGDHHD